MAEFCKSCFAKMIARNARDVTRAVVGRELELCEGCATYQHCVTHVSRLPPAAVKFINKARERR